MSKGLLIFPIYTDIETESSVNKKNKGIIQAFHKLNVPIDIITCTSKGCFLNDKLIYAYSTNKYVRWFQNRHWQYVILAKKINWKEYRFIWIRMGLLSLYKLFFFIKIKKQKCIEIIVEYGAFPFYKELKGAIILSIPFDFVFRLFLHNYVSFAITYCGQKSILKIPVIPIGNGIDIDTISGIHKNENDKDTFRMLSVSTLQSWHGIDRVIRGIALYNNREIGRKVYLNIIGWGPELQRLKKIAKDRGIAKAVKFSGYSVGNELDKAFDDADFAIGTLAMHRKDLDNDSSLKNREYCARGIPFFLSTQDADFPNTLPYVKYIESNDSAVDVAEIIQFYENLQRINPAYINEMQEYAAKNLSWESKIKVVLNVLSAG